MGQFALSFLAGGLSAFSPCVLPTFPLIAGSALQAHRAGPLMVAAGMITSFTFVAVLLNLTGSLFGISPDNLQMASAVLLILFGLMLVVNGPSSLLQRFSLPLASFAHKLLSRFALTGIWGQFLVGALLGAIWMPCAGPILGAAFTLAAEGKELASAAGMMALFGVGAATPLLIVAYVSKRIFYRQTWLQGLQSRTKFIFGVILISFGLLSLTGGDKWLEAVLVEYSPDWLISMTTLL